MHLTLRIRLFRCILILRISLYLTLRNPFKAPREEVAVAMRFHRQESGSRARGREASGNGSENHPVAHAGLMLFD